MKTHTKLFIIAAIAAMFGSLAYYQNMRNKAPLKTYADEVIVNKHQRSLLLMKNGKCIKKYRISLGNNPIGHKTQENDGKTPEGKYIIDYRNPRSKYHLSLHISYPNESDKLQAKLRGVSPGGNIMIHGMPNNSSELKWYKRRKDWTAGCIAVTNDEMEEIWDAVSNRTPIRINP